MEILTKAKQLNTALENSNVEHIITRKLQLAYKAPSTESDPNVQKIEIGSNGRYKIEMAGASGGHVWTGNNDTATGGRAAKVTATFAFTKGQKLGFRVGGEGIGNADLAIISNPLYSNPIEKRDALRSKWGNSVNTWVGSKPGGWNGGGGGGRGHNFGFGVAPGSSGGGATDVRIYAGDSLSSTWTYDNNDPRIMVAAGGGGSAQSANQWDAFEGGHAGVAGQLITNGTRKGTTSTVEVTSDTGYAYTPWPSDPQAPGNSWYTKQPSPNGDKGANGGGDVYYEGRGGVGGGFKGGEAATTTTFKGVSATATGAGGSSHVKSNAISKTITLRNDQFGNGYAIIEWIQ